MGFETFSEYIQKYLRAGGYTQKELAEQLGLHAKVLSRKLHSTYNAYFTQKEIRRILLILVEWHAISTQDEAHELLAAADASSTLFSAEEWKEPPLSTLSPQRTYIQPSSITLPASKHNLPAATTRLIGREWALGRLRQLLERADVRLVTLVGTGGCGKTRLALHLAGELIDTYTHGVWFVDLSRVNDASQVPMSIVQALQIQSAPELSARQGLLAYLRQKHMLLILDNFEHVEAAAPVVAEILETAPDLKILLTSRAVLRLYGEREFSVPPLDVPGRGVQLDSELLARYTAIQLFVERAQAILPDFTLTSENALTIAQICARVDGLPLAIELAAARIRVLPPPLLLERLSNARLPVLTGGARNLPNRQQTLRNTIAWSYNLLSSADQARFRRLGVFTGGWSLEAAEMLIEDIDNDEEESNHSLDIQEQLLDQSLLTRLPTAGRQARFTMLSTLHEYALDQLVAHDELERIRDWHAYYYLQEVEASEPGLHGPEQLAWVARLVADHDNIRAALDWSLQKARAGQPMSMFFIHTMIPTTTNQKSGSGVPDNGLRALEVCLRLAAAFRQYWEWQGYLTEGRHWLKAALDVPLSSDAEALILPARAKAMSEMSRLVFLQNHQEQAIELAEASINFWKRLNDPRGLAFAFLHRGWVANGKGDYEMARQAYKEGLKHLPPDLDPWLYAYLLFHLSVIAGFTSEFEDMHRYYTQSQALFERMGDRLSLADLLKDFGGLLILEGRYQESITCLVQSIRMCVEMNHKQYIATGMGWLSFAVGMRKEPDEVTASIHAARLRGLADSLMSDIGMTHWSETLDFTQIVLQHIHSFVDDQAWEQALATGRTLTIEQAIDLAENAKDDYE